MSVSTCIGCGCTDVAACPGGCWWLRVDNTAQLGVCSECKGLVSAWDKGDRKMRVVDGVLVKPTRVQRVTQIKKIAEGYIKAAGTTQDFGGIRGFHYAYAHGMFDGWFHGGLITSSQMEEYRARLDIAVKERRRRK